MINNIADALCHCRFESTYSTTEESVYQYLLDIMLNCVRCEAGVLLTKNRAWNLVSAVYDTAFCKSVTPVCISAYFDITDSFCKNLLLTSLPTSSSRYSLAFEMFVHIVICYI